MPIIKQETIEAVKQIPLYEIVSPSVNLSRSGRNWKGLSPFTNEKTPSFYVLEDKNYFKCFSSGMAGDGITFVREIEKLNFIEAIETLAERFNIPVQYENNKGPSKEQVSLKRQLYKVHEYAAEFFHRTLLADDELAKTIRDYWEVDRGFSLELAKEFKIGLAPPSGNALNKWLVQKEFSADELKASGLFYPNKYSPQDPTNWNNRFCGRLMIPIREFQGQIVAFTARQLDCTPEDDPAREAKYINSPETPIFVKGRMLFNLDRARQAAIEVDRYLMVEGQLDALRCWSVGLKETVAPQGTAITEEQIRLMKRSASKIDAVLDGDRAGLQAALRLLPLALKGGMDCRIIALPEGEDPDGLLREKGVEYFDRLEGKAVSGMSFATQQLIPKNGTPQEVSSGLEKIYEIIAECESSVAQEVYLDQVIEAGQLPSTSVRRDFDEFLKKNRRWKRPVVKKNVRKSIDNRRLTNAEGDLLWLVLQNSDWATTLAMLFDHEWIDSHSTLGKVLARILNEIDAGNWEGVHQIDSLLDSDEERIVVDQIYVEERDTYNPNDLAKSAISFLAKRYFQKRIQTIDNNIEQSSQDNESKDKLPELLAERRQLNKERLSFQVPEINLPNTTA